MKTPQHTQGPWSIGPICPGDKDIVICSPGVTVDYDDFTEDERREQFANACLIAAAPDLLEALEETRLCLEAWSSGRGPHDATTDVITRATAALAKAQP